MSIISPLQQNLRTASRLVQHRFLVRSTVSILMANPHGYDPFPKTDAFLEEQKERQDYFEYYRLHGDDGYPGVLADIRARKVPAAPVPGRRGLRARRVPAAPVPRRRGARGIPSTIPTPSVYPDVAANIPFDPVPPGSPLQHTQSKFIRERLNSIITRAQLHAAGGFRFVRVLGWGSNGVVSLWHYTAPDGAGNLVLKCRFSDEEAEDGLLNEIEKLVVLARSAHIMQQVRLGLLWPAGTPESIAGQNLDETADFLIAKFARHGDLGKMITTARTKGLNFPRAVLWRFFECLANGVTAMAYPPRLQNAGPFIKSWSGPDLPELETPPGRTRNYKNIIHFDFDPLNIFVDSVGTPNHHPAVPRLQVGDFGLARYMPLEFRKTPDDPRTDYQDYGSYHDTRYSGKTDYYLPEQFAQQWDEVDYEPTLEGVNEGRRGVAGKYSEASNIYAIALSMRCCITKSMPNCPPQPNTRVGYFPRGQRGTFTGPTPIGYGWDIPTNANRTLYGADLCQLLEQCLRHFPADRPSLTDLLAAVAAGVAANPITLADQNFLTAVMGPPGPSVIVPPAGNPAAGMKIPRAMLP